jgi:3-hydroxyisobutyrate dehydrogenase-like beta-hydroxyacid dehydrogenase
LRTVGMIGLGLLGSALAQRLLAAGYDVLGYDLSAGRRDDLIAAGGRAAETAVDVARACDAVVLSLPDADVVAAVFVQLQPALRSGLLIVDTTTGDPAESAALGAKLAGQGVGFLDATIAGSSVQVREGRAIAMVGGNETAFGSGREVLSCFCKEVFHVGPWGSGARMKLVVNLVLGLNRAVLAEGLTLASALELDLPSTLAILKASPAYSTVMDTKGEKMLSGDFAPQARLSQHLKDVRLILAAGAQTGAHLPLSSVHRQLLEWAEAAGLGDLDNSAVIRAFGSGLG